MKPVRRPSVEYIGSGTLKTFAFQFSVEQSSDVRVFVDDARVVSAYKVERGAVVFAEAPKKNSMIKIVHKAGDVEEAVSESEVQPAPTDQIRLTELVDVSPTEPQPGQVLAWGNDKWEPTTLDVPETTTLESLTNVELSKARDNNVLYFSLKDKKWKSGRAADAGLLPLSGGTLSGALNLPSLSTSFVELTCNEYVPNPVRGKVRLFVKEDGTVWVINNAGEARKIITE